MGHGSVLAEIAITPEVVQEPVPIEIVRAPERHGHFSMLFYASGGSPINAQIAFLAQLLPAHNAGNLHIYVPLVPTLPGAPNVSVAQVHAILGPRGLTYYERTHGKTIGYHPTGILLPDQCPRQGFPFSASLTFEDGSHTTTPTTAPCPKAIETNRPSHER